MRWPASARTGPGAGGGDDVLADLRAGRADHQLDVGVEPGGGEIGGRPVGVAPVGDQGDSGPGPITTQPSEPPNDVSQRMLDGVETSSVAPSRAARTAPGRAA